MDRRYAIRQLGLTFGAVIATPTVLSILQSCEKEVPWIPLFFSQDEGVALKKLADLILPRTESPSATDVFTHQFVDKYVEITLEPEAKTLLRNGFGGFLALVKSKANTEDVNKVTEEQWMTSFSALMKVDKEKEKKLLEEFGIYSESIKEDPSASVSEESLMFGVLYNLRQLVIWGYKSTKRIGMEVLYYEQIPGKQQGCISLVEATGGRDYALK